MQLNSALAVEGSFAFDLKSQMRGEETDLAAFKCDFYLVLNVVLRRCNLL